MLTASEAAAAEPALMMVRITPLAMPETIVRTTTAVQGWVLSFRRKSNIRKQALSEKSRRKRLLYIFPSL